MSQKSAISQNSARLRIVQAGWLPCPTLHISAMGTGPTSRISVSETGACGACANLQKTLKFKALYADIDWGDFHMPEVCRNPKLAQKGYIDSPPFQP
jgi:hypothetical protein